MSPGRIIAVVMTCALVTGCGHLGGVARRSKAHEDGVSGSIVEIIVTYQEYSPFMPWQKNQPGVRYGYGVVVDESTVITTENLVRNHRLVELRRPRTGEKIGVSVEISDTQAGLALLKVPRIKAAEGMKPIGLVAGVTQNERVQIYQLDETTQVQRGDAEVLTISVAKLPWAPYSCLTFQLLSKVNINGDGAMVVHDGKLAGIIISYDSSSRTALMLPYPVIKRFLEDARNPPYRGFASAGFLWNTLVDPAKRAYLGVEEEGKGILLLSILPGTGASETLKPNDVILEWDGKQVDNLGFYEDSEFGRLTFSHLIKGRRRPGDTVTATIVRDKKKHVIRVPLRRRTDEDSMIPDNVSGEQAEYLVEGGMIIRELSGKYLMSHGGSWKESVGARIAHLYLTKRYMPEKKGDRVIVLGGALPDPINIGYQRFRNYIITHLNGKPVKTMAQVFRIKDEDGSITRIRLQSVDVDLVLDKDALQEANARLARLYRVSRMSFRRQ